jgi:prolyl 4-hydroxylase
MQSIPQQWKNWVLQNLMQGVAADKILQVMLDKGFAFEPCKRLLGNNLSKDFTWRWDADFYQQLSRIALTRLQSGPQIQPVQPTQLYCWPQFLSAEECAQLVALTDAKVRPSELASPTEDKTFRTSSSADLERRDHPLVDIVNQRIAGAMGVDPAWGEPIQAQRYQLGQEFKAHTDYFEPGSVEYERHGGPRGQRSWTFMIYLNSDCEGGETEFVRLGRTFWPVTGLALIWNNLLTDGSVNPQTLHHAHKISAGVKHVITKWYRDRPY